MSAEAALRSPVCGSRARSQWPMDVTPGGFWPGPTDRLAVHHPGTSTVMRPGFAHFTAVEAWVLPSHLAVAPVIVTGNSTGERSAGVQAERAVTGTAKPARFPAQAERGTALLSRWRSSSLSVTLAAWAFSTIRSGRRDPGNGTTSCPCASSHASASCAVVTPRTSAIERRAPSWARLRSSSAP